MQKYYGRYGGNIASAICKSSERSESTYLCDVVSLPTGNLHYESSLNPVFDEEGVCQFIICITRDITGSNRGEDGDRGKTNAV